MAKDNVTSIIETTRKAEGTPLTDDQRYALGHFYAELESLSVDLSAFVKLLWYMDDLSDEVAPPSSNNSPFFALAKTLGKIDKELEGVMADLNSYTRGEIYFPRDDEKGGAS